MRIVDGRFVTELGDNLLADGDFEADNSGRDPAWPSQDTNRFWVFEGTHVRSGVTGEGALSGNRSLKIIATGKGDNKVNRIETTTSGLTGLENRAEYQVALKAKWVVGSPALLTHGAYNSPSAAPNYAGDHQLPIPENLGTPGAVNSVTLRHRETAGGGNLGPVVAEVMQDPAVPLEGESVTVRARISDADGVAEAMLHYTVDTPKAEGEAEVAAVALVGPDDAGFYEGVIPPQVMGRTVLFWITASDAVGNSGRYPHDPLLRTHPILLDPSAGDVNDQHYLVYRHDTTDGSPRNLSYKFWMHDVNENFLRSRRLLSNERVRGSFVFENNHIYYDSNIRFSGSPWARGRFSSYRTRVPKDNPMWGRITKFNIEDGQFSGRRNAFERVSNYLFRNLGTVYGEGWTATMKLNDQGRNPLREHLQVPSRSYLTRWFGNDDYGPFFEMDDRFTITDSGTRRSSTEAKLQYPPYSGAEDGENKEFYRYFFNPRGGNPFDDFRDLIEFAKFADPSVTDDATFDDGIWEMANVENFMKVFAIRLNTDDWDAWGANRGKNQYFYRPKIDGRWHLIPWDMELTYESRNAFMPPTLSANSNPDYRPGNGFPEVTRWINRPDVKRLYYGIMADMVDEAPFRREFVEPFTERLQEQTGLPPGSSLSFIASRATSLERATQGVTGEFVDFAVDSSDGLVTSNPVVVTGKAPVEVRTIVALINGEMPMVDAEARFSKEDVLGWVYETTLEEGMHTLTFIAYDADDVEVGNVSLDVTVTPPPSGLFRRGDDNGDGRVNLSDAVFNLQTLFLGMPSRCLDAHDTDDSGVVDIADPTFLLTFLFLEGPPPPEPGKDACGLDPTPDAEGGDLGCKVSPAGCE